MQLARVESRAVGGRGLGRGRRGRGDARVWRAGSPRGAVAKGARGRVPQTDPDRLECQGRIWWSLRELILGEQHADVGVNPTAL